MGNKKKPVALAKLQGNPGKGKLNIDEPKPPAMLSFPAPPELFKHDPTAADEWNALGPVLFEMGLITPVDLTAFMSYCKNRSRWLEAEREIDEQGMLIESSNRSGDVSIKKNPAITASVSYQTLMMRAMTEFGMTPSSRAKLIGKSSPDGGDDLDTLEAKGRMMAPTS